MLHIVRFGWGVVRDLLGYIAQKMTLCVLFLD